MKKQIALVLGLLTASTSVFAAQPASINDIRQGDCLRMIGSIECNTYATNDLGWVAGSAECSTSMSFQLSNQSIQSVKIFSTKKHETSTAAGALFNYTAGFVTGGITIKGTAEGVAESAKKDSVADLKQQVEQIISEDLALKGVSKCESYIDNTNKVAEYPHVSAK